MNSWLLTFFTMSLSGSLLALLLFALRPLLAGRMSWRWHYSIWLVVLLRLLLPVGLENSLMTRLFFQSDAAQAAVAGEPSEPSTDFPADSQPLPSLQQPGQLPDAAAPPDRTEASGGAWGELAGSLWLLWLAGAFTLLVRKCSGYHAFLGYIRAGCRPVTDPELLATYRTLYQKTRRTIGNSSPPPLLHNPLAAAPMLVGVFRPVVVLPALETGEAAEYVLRHELTHLRRGDIFYKWLAQLAACLHWYNPLVYRVLRALNRDCELSCDEAVIRGLDREQRYRYGETLLSTIKPDPGYSNAIVSITLNEDTHSLKERLDAIMKYRSGTWTRTAASLLLAAALGLGALWTGVYAAPTGRDFQQTEDARVRSYLESSAAWQEALETGKTSHNQWPDSIAVRMSGGTAGPLTSNFFVGEDTGCLLTVQRESGKVGVLILNDDNHVAFYQADMGSGQFTVRLPASAAKYSLSVYAEQFVGGVLLEAAPDAGQAVPSSQAPASPPTDRETGTAPLTGNAALSYPDYLDLYPGWNSTGNMVDGSWPVSLVAKGSGNWTDHVQTSFLLTEPTSVVITAHTTAGTFGMQIVGPDGTAVFDQPQIISARYRVHLTQPGWYSVHYRCTGYQGRMWLENEAHTDAFAGLDLGLEFGRGENDEPNDPIAIELTEDKSTAADYAAYHVMSYSGSWEMVEILLPYMTKEGVDAVVALANEKNPNNQRVASVYYNLATPGQADSDEHCWSLCVKTGANWVYIEPLFPYMSNAGIERAVTYHNQMTGKRLRVADYYN